MEKPKRLYKYTNLTIGQLIIKTRSIKFSKPSDFNDPFDCDIDILEFNFNSDLTERIQDEIAEIKRRFMKAPGFEEKSKDPTFWERGYKQTQIGKIDDSRISCFSLINDSILMWSHYADKHFGVCFEFDNTVSPRFENLSDEKQITEGEVGYSEYKKINYLSEDRHYSIYKLFISKNTSWSHEKEYRMILANKKPEIQKFNTAFLKAVYFGLRVSPKEISEFIDLCKTHKFNNLEFHRCKKNNLSLEFNKIS